MPYKLSGKNGKGKSVMVHKDGKWTIVKTHPTHEEALAHLAALNIHVKHDGKKE